MRDPDSNHLQKSLGWVGGLFRCEMTECLIDITCQQTQKGMKLSWRVGGTDLVCQFWLKVSVFPPPLIPNRDLEGFGFLQRLRRGGFSLAQLVEL